MHSFISVTLAGRQTENINFQIEFRSTCFAPTVLSLYEKQFILSSLFFFDHYLGLLRLLSLSQLVAARADRQVAAAAAEQLRAQIAELTAQREDAAARHDALIADQEQHYLGTFARVCLGMRGGFNVPSIKSANILNSSFLFFATFSEYQSDTLPWFGLQDFFLKLVFSTPLFFFFSSIRTIFIV